VCWYWDEDDGCLYLDVKLVLIDGVFFLCVFELLCDVFYEWCFGEVVE